MLCILCLLYGKIGWVANKSGTTLKLVRRNDGYTSITDSVLRLVSFPMAATNLSDSMKLKILKMISKAIFIFYCSFPVVWGAVLPIIDETQAPAVRGQLQYHPNMTSMWMVDDYGRTVQVYLTGRPPQNFRNFADVKDNVFYFLYTREYNSAYQLTINDMKKLNSSTFKPNRPTKILIHGFWNNFRSDSVQIMREAYLNHYDVNVLAVDWGALAEGPWYVEAVQHTQPVGQLVGQLVDWLVISSGAALKDFHLVGHSLGAHVAAFASNSVSSGIIQRITGLDPALPLFSNREPSRRLDPSDAALVDCIHTCGGYLGFYQPLCSFDFYPNGGTASQPGCHWDFTGACSHGRSYRYFSASLTNNFTARSCASIDDMRRRRCSGQTGLMGDRAKYS
ncbi:hypothetical protein J6590_020952 [Homalodisca vitripennis]|nr:hypothetical protein J6590_020952 [Homalodisca vitripennis]